MTRTDRLTCRVFAACVALCALSGAARADFVSTEQAERLRTELARRIASRKGMWTDERKAEYVRTIVGDLQAAPQILTSENVDRFLKDFPQSGYTFNNDPSPTAVWYDMEVEIIRSRIQNAFLVRMSQTPEERAAVQSQKAEWLGWSRQAMATLPVRIPKDIQDQFIEDFAPKQVESKLDNSLSYSGSRPLTVSEQAAIKAEFFDFVQSYSKGAFSEGAIKIALERPLGVYEQLLQDRASGSTPAADLETRISAQRQKLFGIMAKFFINSIIKSASGTLEPPPGPREQKLADIMQRQVEEEMSGQPGGRMDGKPAPPPEVGTNSEPPAVEGPRRTDAELGSHSPTGQPNPPVSRPVSPRPSTANVDATSGRRVVFWVLGALSALAVIFLACKALRRGSPVGATPPPADRS